MIPGHCYLAFALDETGEKLAGLETTLLQSAPPAKVHPIKGLSKLLDKEWLEADSFAVFCSAIAMGNADLAKNKAKFADEDEPDFCIMSVSAARKMGILPIGFKSNAEFAPEAK